MRKINDWTAHKLTKRTRNNLWFEEQGEERQLIRDEIPITDTAQDKQQNRARIPKEFLKMPEQSNDDLYFNSYITLQ